MMGLGIVFSLAFLALTRSLHALKPAAWPVWSGRHRSLSPAGAAPSRLDRAFRSAFVLGAAASGDLAAPSRPGPRLAAASA